MVSVLLEDDKIIVCVNEKRGFYLTTIAEKVCMN